MLGKGPGSSIHGWKRRVKRQGKRRVFYVEREIGFGRLGD